MPSLSAVPSPTAPLDELVRATRAGDARGLAGLYDRYAATLFRAAYRLSGSTADAEDVVHDVFVGLPEALRRYDERGSFAGWLTRVAVRATLMRARRGRRRREAPLDDAYAMPSQSRTDAGAEHTDVARAIQALPDGLRAVFVLKQIEGYSHDEIASLLGITAGASRVRLTRALETLRHALR